MYDGSSLTASGYSYTGNLAAGDKLVVTVSGSITDAGTAQNVVSSYKVMRGNQDVTSNYTFSDSINGLLTITQRNVTLTSASASKVYDGMALTNHNITITGDGFANGESYTANVSGSQTNVGSSANSYTYVLNGGTKAVNYNITKVEGTLTVTKDAVPITITADSETRTYDGTVLTNSGYTYTGKLAATDRLEVTVSGSITDVGTANNVVTSYKVMRGDVDVTENYTFNASVKGTLTVTKRNVTLTSNSSSQKYDGTELEGTVTVGGAGFVSGEATASACSITDAGSITNTITVNEGAGYKASNYNIIKNEGTLTVTKRNVTLTSASDVKNYDGTPLTNHNVTVTGDGFVGEESYTVNVTGSQTEIGESKNTFAYKLTDGAKEQNYDVTKVEGTLEVTKDAVPITITAKSGSQMYDGTAFSLNDFTYTGTIAVGDELFVTVTGSITDAGTADNVVSNYKVMRGKEDVTKNYTFNESVKGTLEVTKRDVTLTSNSASRKYNGDVLEGTVTVGGDGFVAGEATASASSITDAGTITNTITVNASTGYKESNYNITKNEGTLTVTKRQVTLTSASDSKVYDGTALTNHNISVSGDGFVSGEGYTANVTGSQIAVGSSKNTFTYELTNGATTQNYDVMKVEGTLTVKEGSEPTPVKSLVVDSDMTLTADSSYSSITVKEDAKLTVDASITTAKLTVAGSEVAVTVAGSLDVSGTATISGTSTLTGILDAESVTIYTKADVEAATLNTGKVTVNTGAKLAVTDAINGSDDADAVKLGSNAVLTAGTIDLDEGSNTVTVGSKASVTVGTISGVRKLTLSSNAKMDVTEYTGTAAKDTMSIGSGATFEAVKVDLGDAANAITVSGKADVKISELEGSLNKLSLSSGTSGDLTIFAADKISGTDAADNLSIGSYADVKIGSDISLGSGNDTVKIGSNSTFTANVIELGDGTNSVTVGSNSTATVASISDVSKLTLSSKATLTVTDAYTGTEAKDTMSIGSGATFEAGKVDLGDAANAITVSGKADVKIGELEGSLNKLTLSSGTESDLTTFATNTVNGTNAADKLSIGNYADVKFSGDIDLAEGNDTVAVGKFSKFAAGTIDFGEGTGDKFTAGYQSNVKLEAVTGLNQFITQYGTEDRLTKVDVAGDIQFSADATTTGNKLTIAKYTDMNVHGLIDFNDAKNTVVVGNDSTVVLKAEDAAKVAKFTIGTGAEAYLSSELAAKVSSNKGTVYDIGTADVAVNFSSAADETSDNSIADARDLADRYDGWLNNDIDSVDYLKTGTEDMTVSFGKDYTNFEVKTGANWTAVTSEILAVSADTQFGIRLASDVKGSFAYTVKK